jgi:2-dehydro-3-deoxygluconokinase
MSDVVTFGETMALVAPPGAEPLRHTTTLALSTGGAESNVAIGLARLGVRASWYGRVGDDALGGRVVRDVRGEGVAVHAVVDPAAPTGLMVKERRGPAVRVSYYRRHSAGSRLCAADVPDAAVAGARILHVTGITPALSATARAAVSHAVAVARAAGTVVSLDLNHRRALWADADFGATIRSLLPSVDVVFAGAEEAALVVGPGTPAAQASALAALGPAQAVLKLGAEGALCWADGTVVAAPAVPVTVVDPVGAGDAFVAGWLAEHLADPADVRAALRTATACGALACTAPGDWEGTPFRPDLVPHEGDLVRR